MAHNDTHAARKKGGAGKILLVVLLLLLLAVGAAVHFAYNEIHGNGAPGSTEVTVSIPQGSGVAAIANKLKEAGVIRSAYLFRWYVGQKGAAAKLQYGDFVLQTSAISYDAIIATLSQYAKAETVRVTIPEGTTAIAIAQKMESAAYMLEHTDKSVLQIAGEHGYDNGSKFASAFRQVKGMTPSAYRAAHRCEPNS